MLQFMGSQRVGHDLATEQQEQLSSGFIHVVSGARIFFLFKTEQYSIVWIDHMVFVHSGLDGHLGVFLTSAYSEQ